MKKASWRKGLHTDWSSTMSAEKEYEDLSANMRHYMNMHFAEMTVLVAITAGLMTIYTAPSTSPPSVLAELKCFIPIGGMVVSVCFWIMEESALYLWRQFIRRAAALECSMGYDQYKNLPFAPDFRWWKLPGSWAVRFVCIVILSFWFYSFFHKL